MSTLPYWRCCHSEIPHTGNIQNLKTTKNVSSMYINFFKFQYSIYLWILQNVFLTWKCSQIFIFSKPLCFLLALMCFIHFPSVAHPSVFRATTSLRPYLHQSLTSPVLQRGISQCWCQQTPTTLPRSQTGCRSTPEHLLSEFTPTITHWDASTLMSWVYWVVSEAPLRLKGFSAHVSLRSCRSSASSFLFSFFIYWPNFNCWLCKNWTKKLCCVKASGYKYKI